MKIGKTPINTKPKEQPTEAAINRKMGKKQLAPLPSDGIVKGMTLDASAEKFRLEYEKECPSNRKYRIEIMAQLFGGGSQNTSVLENLEILDLGCGTGIGEPGCHSDFEPNVCRMLSILRAKPIGIDYNEPHGEKFESYSIDLRFPGSLNFLKDGKFDIVHSSFFLPPHESPSLFRDIVNSLYHMSNEELASMARRFGISEFDVGELQRNGASYFNPFGFSPHGLAKLVMREDIVPEINAQALRLLKEEGYFMREDRILQKKNNEFRLFGFEGKDGKFVMLPL